MTYNPDESIVELRRAIEYREPTFRAMAESMAVTARAMAAELWPDRPDLAEAAGLGAIMAASSVAGFAHAGGESTMLNAVGLIGLGLVEQARGAEVPATPAAGLAGALRAQLAATRTTVPCTAWELRGCPNHGDCSCAGVIGTDAHCRLHGVESMHGPRYSL